MTRIVFYFPYMEESGVPVLFLRMSRWLAENYGNEFDVYIGDYADGAMARNLRSSDKVKLCISGSPDGITIWDNDIIVLQTLIPYYFPKELHMAPKSRVFYWTLHFQNLTPSLLPFPGLRELPFNYLWVYKTCSIFYHGFLTRICKMIDDMMLHNAHYFMDISTRQQTQRHLPISVPKGMDYLPVPASDYNGKLKETNSNFDSIEACWIGRISFEKTPILVHILERCSKYALDNKQKINFHVVGSGEYIEWVDNLPIENEYFKKTKCEPIKFSKINSYLLDNVDVMFAMGTSALESAKLGIPTVLVDYTATAKPIKGDYIFRYIFEREGYDLAHLISNKDLKDGNNSLNTIFDQLINNYTVVAERSRIHFVEKHSLLSVGSKFCDIIRNLTYTFDMIDPKVIQRPFILRFYNKLRGFDR